MKRIECEPRGRRYYSGPIRRGSSQSATGITVACGRNFLNEPVQYPFPEGVTENDHNFPLTLGQDDVPFEDQVIFPPAKKDGIVTIFDGWSALTRKQMSGCCPFYDVEKGCMKAQALGKERISDEEIRKQHIKEQKAAVKVAPPQFKLSKSALDTIEAFGADANQDEVILVYVGKIAEENPNKADELLEVELPYIINALDRKRAGLDALTDDLKPKKQITLDSFKKISQGIPKSTTPVQTESAGVEIPPDENDPLAAFLAAAQKALDDAPMPVEEKKEEPKPEPITVAAPPPVPKFSFSKPATPTPAPAVPKFGFSTPTATIEKPKFGSFLDKLPKKD
jgi:hypothetical protein